MKPRQPTPQQVGSHDIISNATAVLRQHSRVLAGNVSFGSGVNGDTSQNINGVWVSGTTPGTPSTPFSVVHTLGRVPVGFDVKRINAAGSIYDSGTPWTSTEIFIESNVGSATFSLFIF